MNVNPPLDKSSRTLYSLYLASFIIISGYSVIVPFLPLYANELLSEIVIGSNIVLGVAFQIGIITAGNLLMKFLLSPAYGDLSDLSGRKPIIVIGMAVYTFLMAGYGLASDFLSLFFLRTLSGVASAAVWPVGQALVVDASSEERKGRNLGFYMLSMMAGMTTGPFIGYGFFTVLSNSGFSEILAYRYTFIGVASLGLIATLFLIFNVIDPRVQNIEISMREIYYSSLKQLLRKTLESPVFIYRIIFKSPSRSSDLYTVYFVAIVNGFATALLLPITALFLEEYYFLSSGEIAIIIGIVGLFALFGAPVGGSLSDKIGRKRTVWISGVSVAFFVMLLGIKTEIIILVIIFTLIRFLFMSMQSSFRAFQSDLIPDTARGKEFGIVDATYNFGAILGPIFGGYLYDLFYLQEFQLINNITLTGAGVAYICSGILLLISNFALIIFAKEQIKINS